MTNQVSQVDKVADIIKVLNGGISFYQEASEKVESHGVKSVFGRMISAKRNAIAKLQPYAIAEKGEVETDSSMAVDMRKMYTKVLGAVTDTDHTYVDQLEEVEDKTLEVIREALEEDQPTPVNKALLEVLDDANSTHDEMKALQETTA